MTLVTVEQREDVRTLTLGRPERANALSPELVDELIAELSPARLHGVGVLVIAGAERHFCAGFDLSDVDALSDGELTVRMLRVGYLLELMYAAPCLTVSHATGTAIGAGADLFAACDLRIAGPRAAFAFPGSAFGVVLGTRRLAALVGSATALEWVATGRRINADEAEAAGLISHTDVEVMSNVAHRRARTLYELASATRQQQPMVGLGELAASIVGEPGLAERIRRHAKGVADGK